MHSLRFKDCFSNKRIRNSSSEFRMAAEAIGKHFQQQSRYKPPGENFDAVTGDYAKRKSFNSKRSNIYVHEFFNLKQTPVNCESQQNQLHRNLYNHETGYNPQHKPELRRKYSKNSNVLIPWSERIKSRSFQDSYVSNEQSSSYKCVRSPMQTFSNSKEVIKSRDTIAKLEESYWANWRPNRSETVQPRKIPKAHYRVIRKRLPLPKPKPTDSSSSDDEEEDVKTKMEKAILQTDVKNEVETQVENLTEKKTEEPVPKISAKIPAKKSEEIQVPADLSRNAATAPIVQEVVSEKNILQKIEEADEVTPLKHTDSFILTAKRQSEEKPRYQQPRCIKLFRKPIVSGSGANITRGGSYPLKSSIKKEKPVFTGNIRLGKPGSPIMIQANVKAQKRI